MYSYCIYDIKKFQGYLVDDSFSRSREGFWQDEDWAVSNWLLKISLYVSISQPAHFFGTEGRRSDYMYD